MRFLSFLIAACALKTVMGNILHEETRLLIVSRNSNETVKTCLKNKIAVRLGSTWRSQIKSRRNRESCLSLDREYC